MADSMVGLMGGVHRLYGCKIHSSNNVYWMTSGNAEWRDPYDGSSLSADGVATEIMAQPGSFDERLSRYEQVVADKAQKLLANFRNRNPTAYAHYISAEGSLFVETVFAEAVGGELPIADYDESAML